ncbi:MAG: diphthine--ammonia ligase [Nitrospirota bacterium]
MYLSSWSGGKDSCFACYRAMQSGYKIVSLVNFISREYKRVRFHGTDSRLIQVQSELLGIPLCQKETSPDDYEPAFKNAVTGFKPLGAKGMIFDDLYLDEHRQWVERVCGELGIEAIEPLWKIETEKIMNDFISEGFGAVIVSAQKKSVDREWIGKKVDKRFLGYLKTKPEVDVCGENGEYHTFVVSGPLFKGRINITESQVIERDGYWFLDIKGFEVIR